MLPNEREQSIKSVSPNDIKGPSSFWNSFEIIKDFVLKIYYHSSNRYLQKMVSLQVVQQSNARIVTTLAPGFVALFIGASSGIDYNIWHDMHLLHAFIALPAQPQLPHTQVC